MAIYERDTMPDNNPSLKNAYPVSSSEQAISTQDNVAPVSSNEETIPTQNPPNLYEPSSEIPALAASNAPYIPNPYKQAAPPPAPNAVVPYSKIIFLGLIAAMIIALLVSGVPGLGIGLFGGALISMFVIDWKGLLTTAGLLKWKQMSNDKRVGMGCLLCCFFPVFLIIYLFRIGPKIFQAKGPVFSKEWNAPAPIKKRANFGIIVGSISAIVLLLISIPTISANTNTASTSTTLTAAQTVGVPASTTKPASTPTPVFTPTPTPTPTPKPTPTPVPYAQFNDGTFVVGQDIQPGTYRTRNASPGCYYARLKGFGGTVDDILANNNTDNPAIVTILPTDKGFESNNCDTWTKDLSAITASQTSFDDGMYIVGTDIQPGTYKSSGQSGCYYARLSGFSNTTDDILANNNTDTPAIVTISPGDKGFQSNNCGTWTKE